MQQDFTALSRASFWGRSRALMARRIVIDTLIARPPRLARPGEAPAQAPLIEDRSALYPDDNPAEHSLQLGKVENLRVAARRLDGLAIGEGQLFSFWRAVGPPRRRHGFVVGRELRQGCIIPAVAGGICQLTNALSRVATRSGQEIVERHKHTAVIAGVTEDTPEDATVFWNYLDFRFRAVRPLTLSVTLDERDLIVALYAV